jgi:hypothetical protein
VNKEGIIKFYKEYAERLENEQLADAILDRVEKELQDLHDSGLAKKIEYGLI